MSDADDHGRHAAGAPPGAAGAPVDQPRAIRDGEELDRARLSAYLSDRLGPSAGGGPLEIEQFPGGHSNLTYLVRVGGAEYVLRRPPLGTRAASAHDMGREYRVLSALAPVYAKAPRPVLLCDDDSVLGAPFYLMERRRGVIVRRALPPALSAPHAGPEVMSALCAALIDALAELHSLDVDALGLGELGKPAGYVERQIEGWTRRWAAARTDDIPDVERVAAWLAAHRPADGHPALIHNDFKLDNVILDPAEPTRIIGVLDWEMCTLGDARMDLGTALSYWVQADDPAPMQLLPFGPSVAPGMWTRRQLADRWAERVGASAADMADLLFYYCYGLFKTAVVAQQIYYRYARGQTRDARFAQMIHGVRVLSAQAAATLDRGEI